MHTESQVPKSREWGGRCWPAQRRLLPLVFLSAAHHSPWPLPHDLSSLLPWQGSSDEIRKTTGMTQCCSGKLTRVKSRACVCACWTNLIFTDSWATLSASIWDLLPLEVCGGSKRWRQESEWGGMGCDRRARREHDSLRQSRKAYLSGTTSSADGQAQLQRQRLWLTAETLLLCCIKPGSVK